MCEVISIANQKGGVGKTTTAINLGVALEQLGKHTLLVDLDSQGNLSDYLGFYSYEDSDSGEPTPIDELPTISDLMFSQVGLTAVSVGVGDCIRHSERNGIDYIPADLNLANADYFLANAIARETILKRVLADIKDRYDYIIIDCLPSLGLLLINALVASNGFIVPAQTQKFSYSGLVALENIYGQVKSTLNPELKLIGVLATMYDGSTNASKNILAKLGKKYPEEIFKAYIHKAAEAEKSTNSQRSLCLYKNRPGEEYKAVAKELIGRCG